MICCQMSSIMEVGQDKAEVFTTTNDTLNIPGDLPLTQQLQEISVYNELMQQDSILDVTIDSTSTSGYDGIEANDIGSLFEQFLEYEQESEDVSSYPDSSFMTPVASPGEPNEDVVLGRLMIVQEKLTREVADDPGTIVAEIKDEDNNNRTITKVDGLLRTVNGVHPKGSNVRMADSPKFAKFKKKKLSSDPPVRRCFSGPTTPRCTSPSEMVSPEELKKREAKLIEALALTVPKQKTENTNREIDKAKRNLAKSAVQKKGKPATQEPIASRLMPVVSKRKKKVEQPDTKVNDPCIIDNKNSADPRLNKTNYGEQSNITQLKDTKLIDINSSSNTATETVDDISIVDMTIDHETLAGAIITVQHTTQKKETGSMLVPDTTSTVENSNDIKQEETPNQNEIVPPVIVQSSDQVKTDVVKPPKNYRKMNLIDSKDKLIKTETEEKAKIVCALKRKLVTKDSPSSKRKYSSRSLSRSPSRNRSRSPVWNRSKRHLSNRSVSPSRTGTRSLSRAHSRSPSRLSSRNHSRSRSRSPFRNRSGSLSRARSRSLSRARSRSPSRVRSRSPSRVRSRSPSRVRSRSLSRARSRSPSRVRSKSPSRVRSRSPSRARSHKSRSRRSSHSSSNESVDETHDISSKLSELSNPVPYDIEHERKVRFLCGGASRGTGLSFCSGLFTIYDIYLSQGKVMDDIASVGNDSFREK